jgi:hypothetical protein
VIFHYEGEGRTCAPLLSGTFLPAPAPSKIDIFTKARSKAEGAPTSLHAAALTGRGGAVLWVA